MYFFVNIRLYVIFLIFTQWRLSLPEVLLIVSPILETGAEYTNAKIKLVYSTGKKKEEEEDQA